MPGPQYRRHGEREEDGREGEEDVHRTHDEAAQPLASHSRRQAQHEPPERGNQHGQHGDGDGDPAAPDEPAQDVPTAAVGAQNVAGSPDGGESARLGMRHVRIVGADEGCRGRCGDDERDDDHPRERQSIPAERQKAEAKL